MLVRDFDDEEHLGFVDSLKDGRNFVGSMSLYLQVQDKSKNVT